MAENNENRPIAIQVSGVKKMYKLGQIGGGTLQRDLQSWWARKRGKEDPNSKIGEGERSHGDTFMALNGVDLTIYQGEAVGIIGHNGAGKSTLLKLLSRVTAPTEGEIDINGRIASMLEVGTGFNGELTGRENVYMNGAILGMTKSEIDAKMEQIIEFSEVREFIDTPVKRYSSGMFVKLAFSVAAHLDAEIMIMDEVLAVGDMAFQKKCLTKMREAAKQDGRTVLYVSHNMNTIRQLCDRCIVLDKGKVIFEGDVEEGINEYLGTKVKNSNIIIDFSKEMRAPFLVDKNSINLYRFELLNRNNYDFCLNDVLRFRLNWDSFGCFKNVSLRVKLVSSNGNEVASYYLDSFINLEKGSYDKIFEIDLKDLMYGKYMITFVFSYTLIEGRTELLEAIVDGVSFEVLKNDTDIYWSSQYWGHIKFDRIKVIENDD